MCFIFISTPVFANNAEDSHDENNEKETFIYVSNNVPEGFEDLAGPKINQIDVYYQGSFLISTEATYDFETLTFHSPEIIIENISYLLDPDFILKNISQPLEINSDQLCLSHSSNIDCGVLEPNVAGIIFDEGRFKVDLFINPQQLEVQFIESSKFLPDAEDKFSTVHNFSLNLSGTDVAEDTFNAQTNSIISYGDVRLLAQTNYTDEENILIDEASIQKDYRGWEAEAGVFESESRSTNFFSQVDVTGIRAQTSLNTRTDIKSSRGTDIFIFLSVRSRVEVFRNNRLIDARFYEAGNRQIDTTRFPDGAYQISVRIREENGAERIEEYFFVRNSLLPPLNEPILYAEVGHINEFEQDTVLPKVTDEEIIHIGGAIRATESIALEGEIVRAGDQTMLQAGIVHIGSGIQSQINAMTTTESDWAISIRENYATNKFTVGADFRYVSQGDKEILDNDEFDLVTSDSTQATASFSHEFLGGRAFWRYRHLDLNGREKSETYSIDYRRQIARTREYQLDWDLTASKDTNDYLFSTNLVFSFREKNNIYRINSGIQSAETSGSRDNAVTGSARWQHTRRDPNFGRIQSQLFYQKERNFDSAGAMLSSESRYGFNEVAVNKTINNDRDILDYSIRSQLSFASDFKNVSIGGARQNSSAIIIDLDGQPEGSSFEVFIDRQSVGFATVGSNTVFPLPPYETYDVRLESRASTFLQFDEAPREVTLYPGNVNSLRWQVDRVVVLIGKVIGEDGEPVKNAKIQNVGAFSGTDNRGWFQIETSKTNELILQQNDGSTCKINLGEYNGEEDVHVFDELICVDNSTIVTGI
ncbi:MAG: CS1-pili formation C-terminal domain-containing protein [Gammaproteobacteria bacterium]